MRAEEKWEINIIIYLLLMALMLLNLSGYKEFQRTKELAEQVAEIHSELEAKEAQYNDRLEHISKEINELNDRLDEIIMLSYDYDYTVRVVAAECGGEPVDGQMAVAQTVLERSLEWGMTPEQVVKAPGQYTDPLSLNAVSETTWEVCKDVLLHGERIYDKPVKWFYNPSMGRSRVHEGKELVGVIGNHAFFC